MAPDPAMAGLPPHPPRRRPSYLPLPLWQAMLEESHFTFKGLMRHIERLLTDPSDADLRCQPL